MRVRRRRASVGNPRLARNLPAILKGSGACKICKPKSVRMIEGRCERMDRDIEELIDFYARAEPKLWGKAYPRVYEGISNYESPRFVALNLVHSIRFFDKYREATSLTAGHAAVLASRAFDYDLPAYFVGGEFLTAISHTDLPAGIKWTEATLPYDAGLLYLPVGALLDPEGASVNVLGWHRQRKGERIVVGETRLDCADDAFVVWGLCDQSAGRMYSRAVNASQTPYIAAPTTNYERRGIFDLPLTKEDEAFVSQMVGLCFSLLIAQTAKPELVTEGHRQGKHTKRGNREFWTPNFIGRKYVIRREYQGGTHESPRFHWRPGHWTHQPIGKGARRSNPDFVSAATLPRNADNSIKWEEVSEDVRERFWRYHKPDLLEPVLVEGTGERVKINGLSLEAGKHAEDLMSHWVNFANDRTDFQTLAENSHIEYLRDPENARAGIIYMNSHARRFYELILSEEMEKEVSFPVFATSADNLVEHQKMLDKYIGAYAANPEAVRAMNAIKEAINLAQADDVDGVVFFDVHLPSEDWKVAADHEDFHIWQYGAPELPEGWVESQPGYDRMRSALLARGYQDDPKVIAREWAAFAAMNDLEQFGFRREEGAGFLNRYFDKIIDQSGIEALDRVGNVSADARTIIENKRSEYERNHSRSQQQSPTEARGLGASAGSETSDIATGRDASGDRHSLQGRCPDGWESGGRASDAGETQRNQRAGSTFEDITHHGGHPVNHGYNSIPSSAASFRNAIQQRTLEKIAAIDLSNPADRRLWSEIGRSVVETARAAVFERGGGGAVGSALQQIAEMEPVNRPGAKRSWKDVTLAAMETARAALETSSQGANARMDVGERAVEIARDAHSNEHMPARCLTW